MGEFGDVNTPKRNDRKMGKIEVQVQKNVTSFCKYLGEHVDEWKSVLQGSDKSIVAIQNQSEQLRHVERAKLRHMEGFEETQSALKFSILNGIEDELPPVKQIIDKLNKANQNLRNKLATLEKSTLDLDWNRESALIKGSPTQPPLGRILGEGLEFWCYFKKAFDNINGSYKMINVRSEKSLKAFEKAFRVDLDDKIVTDFVAVTQYVLNAKSIS